MINWVDCKECGHQFTDGYFEGDALRTILNSEIPGQSYDGISNLEGQRMHAADVVCSVTKLIDGLPSGRWLDVGCGSGALLATAAEFGFETMGIDLRESSVVKLMDRGFDANLASIKAVPSESRFHVISMADVLEHEPFPVSALEKARELLYTNGLLYVSCPNRDSFVWREMDATKSNPYWRELEHFHNFSRVTLMNLLSKTGFQPVSFGVHNRYKAGMEIVAVRN